MHWKSRNLKILFKDRNIMIFCFFSAVILRALYLLTPPLSSDFAVIGLAARHILKGEIPFFFYGDYFEGIIEAYLAAPLFFIFGSSRLILDCVPALMSLLVIYTIYKLAQAIYGNTTAKLTLVFSSIAPSYFLISTIIPLEGYIETTILGALAFLITYKIIYPASYKHSSSGLYFLLGLVIGFALYLQFHIIPFAITAAIFIFLNNKKIFVKKEFLLMLLGFIIGNSPLLIYNVTHNFPTLHTIGLGRESSTFYGTLKHLFGYGYWVILGAKSEYAPSNYIPYISPLILFVYLVSFIYLIIKRKRGSELLITFLLIFPVIYWLSGRGESNTRRYLIPLYSVIFIVLAHGITEIMKKNKFLSYCLAALVLGSNLYTNFVSIPIFNKVGLAEYKYSLMGECQLYDFLKKNNIKGAYAFSWWDSLKFNFDFKEDIILTLYNNEPYPKYQKIVDSKLNPAFVDHFSEFAYTLNSIGGSYETCGIPNQMGTIYPYTVHYNFTPTDQTLEEIDYAKWSASSSHNINAVSLAFDRDISTRWHSDTAQRKYMSFTLDMKKIYNNVTRISYNPGPAADCPFGCSLYASTNGKDWRLISKNPNYLMPIFWDGPHPFVRSINGLVEIDFKPQPVRYLKLILTKDKERLYWSIAEIFVYRQKNARGFRQNDWDLADLKNRLNIIKPKKIYADPWILSNIKAGFYCVRKADTIDNNYLYKYFIVEPNKLKNSVFIILKENFLSFAKMVGNIKYNAEDFGPYILVSFNENYYVFDTFYWDGFHLLKIKQVKHRKK